MKRTPLWSAIASNLLPRGEGVKLKAVYDSQDDIPEAFVDLFTERGGKWECTGIQGIRTAEDVSRIEEANRKEREDHKETKKKLAAYEKLGDLETITEMHDGFPELKAAAAAGDDTEKKVEEMVTARLNAKMKPLERERDELATRVGEQETAIANYEASDKSRKIRDEIVKAAGKAKGFETHALDDAILLGSGTLEIDDTGRIQTKDGAGVPAGLDAELWLQEIAPSKPHWFGASSGSGALGAGGGGGGGLNPWSAKSFNVTQQGQMERDHPEKAERYRKAAGYADRKDVPHKAPAE